MPEPQLEPFRLPFDQAISWFKDKLPLPSETFDQLAGDYQQLAFTISGVTDAALLQDFYDACLKAIEQGTTFEQFQKDVAPSIEKAGWAGATPYRTFLIYSQNLRTAYAEGYRQQMDTEAMLTRRPFRMWVHRDSVNFRPAHKALHQQVFEAESDFYKQVRCPAGFGCRCTWLSLSERDMQRRGLKVSQPPKDYLTYVDKISGEKQRVPAVPIDGKLEPVIDTGFVRVGTPTTKEGRDSLLQRGLQRLSPGLREQVEKRLKG